MRKYRDRTCVTCLTCYISNFRVIWLIFIVRGINCTVNLEKECKNNNGTYTECTVTKFTAYPNHEIKDLPNTIDKLIFEHLCVRNIMKNFIRGRPALRRLSFSDKGCWNLGQWSIETIDLEAFANLGKYIN